MNKYQLLIPLAVPFLVAGVKALHDKIPAKWLPIVAPLIGGVLDGLAAWNSGGPANPALGALLGSAGVGIREVVDQWTKSGPGSALKIVLVLMVALILPGCASMHTTVTERDFDGSERTTEMQMWTLFDGQTSLTKWKSTNTDKTQSVGLDGGEASSSGTNATALVGTIVQAAVAGAVQGATGK